MVPQRGLTASHPDRRHTTSLCGGESKAQRPIKGTKHWPGGQKSGVQTSAPPPPGCVTLGKSRSLSVPQVPHLQTGGLEQYLLHKVTAGITSRGPSSFQYSVPTSPNR